MSKTAGLATRQHLHTCCAAHLIAVSTTALLAWFSRGTTRSTMLRASLLLPALYSATPSSTGTVAHSLLSAAASSRRRTTPAVSASSMPDLAWRSLRAAMALVATSGLSSCRGEGGEQAAGSKLATAQRCNGAGDV